MIKTRQDIKEIFVAGSYPSEADYHDALDSYVHKDDLIAASRIDGLGAAVAGGSCHCQACRPVTLDIALQWLEANSQGSVHHVEFYASPQLAGRIIAVHADGLALQAIDDPTDLATNQSTPTQYHLEACAEGEIRNDVAGEMEEMGDTGETEEAVESEETETEDSETGESGGTAPVRYLLSIDAAPVRSLTLTYCHQGTDDTIAQQHLQLLG